MICKTPLWYEPGTKTVYSDVDYMVLGLSVDMALDSLKLIPEELDHKAR